MTRTLRGPTEASFFVGSEDQKAVEYWCQAMPDIQDIELTSTDKIYEFTDD